MLTIIDSARQKNIAKCLFAVVIVREKGKRNNIAACD